MSKNIQTIKVQLNEAMPILKQEFQVQTLEIFGSYVRSEQTNKSDLDLLITFSEPYDLWKLLDVKEFLAKKLHMKVDLVPKDSIKNTLKDRILEEAISI